MSCQTSCDGGRCGYRGQPVAARDLPSGKRRNTCPGSASSCHRRSRAPDGWGTRGGRLPLRRARHPPTVRRTAAASTCTKSCWWRRCPSRCAPPPGSNPARWSRRSADEPARASWAAGKKRSRTSGSTCRLGQPCQFPLRGDVGRGRTRAHRSLVGDVELVHGVKLELDLFPGFHGDLEFGRLRRSSREDLLAFLLQRPAFVAGLHASFQGHAVGAGAGRIAPGVAQRAASELQHRVVAEDADQRRHVPDVDAAGGHRESARHRTPVLIEEDAARAVLRNEGFAQQVDPAEGGGAVAFELAHHGAGVQMVAARQTQDLGENAEVDAVVRVAVDHRVHGAVDVQQHAVLAAPVGQAGVGTEAAGDVVVHDDRRADGLGVLGAAVHLFGRGGRHVQVVTLAFAGLPLGLQGGFLHEIEPLAPAHERLAVDVFVVLGEVQTAAQALVHRATVVLGRQTQLGLDGATQQRAGVLVHDVALDLDAQGRAAAGLDVGDGEAHILQSQGAQRLEPEHVAHQRGEHVDHRALLEQVDGIGHEGVEAGVVARHILDSVGATLVVIQVGQQVGPHRGPGAGGRLRCHGRRHLFPIHARLRRDLEHRQDVGIQGGVLGHPVGLTVFLDAGVVSLDSHAFAPR
mmetsp:Transcript_38712/g.90622  ORF Transcript_38712/g.90622 Transcript_38712/m.90622 type:complete len:631 (-) Transcript_38712:1357-3249(-)